LFAIRNCKEKARERIRSSRSNFLIVFNQKLVGKGCLEDPGLLGADFHISLIRNCKEKARERIRSSREQARNQPATNRRPTANLRKAIRKQSESNQKATRKQPERNQKPTRNQPQTELNQKGNINKANHFEQTRNKTFTEAIMLKKNMPKPHENSTF